MHLTLATFPVTFVSSRVFPSCHRWSFRQSRTLAPKSNIVTFLTNAFKNTETQTCSHVLSHAIVQRILAHACLGHVICHQCWLCFRAKWRDVYERYVHKKFCFVHQRSVYRQLDQFTPEIRNLGICLMIFRLLVQE